jgi:hypothetical protein
MAGRETQPRDDDGLPAKDGEDFETKNSSTKNMFYTLANFDFKPNNQANSYTQFRCYIGNIDNMSDLKYYFDSRKGSVTETNVKDTFKQLLYNKTNDALTLQGQEIFDVIWGKTVLRGNLFQGINFNDPDALNEGKRQFISKIKDTSNSFYNFINVR